MHSRYIMSRIGGRQKWMEWMPYVRKKGVEMAQVDSYVPRRKIETETKSLTETCWLSWDNANSNQKVQEESKDSANPSKYYLSWEKPFSIKFPTDCKNCGINVNIQNISRGFRKESILTCGLIPVKSFYLHLQQSPERTTVAGGW